MFTSFHVGHYVPLTWVSFGLDYLLWGMDPFGYHLTNQVLHAANAVLFFLIAVRLLGLAMPALRADSLGLRLAALAAALLFSVHPLRVESVAWATERRDVLCAFFYLLAILAYLNAHDANAHDARAPDAASVRARNGRLWYAATITAGAAAMLSKSMAVSLPVILILLDFYPLKRLTLDRSLLLEAGRRRVLAEKAPLFLVAAAVAVLAVLAVGRSDSLTAVSRLGIVERLSIACFSLAFYLWKVIVPLNLSPLYELPVAIRWWSLPFALSALVVLGITGLAVGLRRRWPALGAVWAGYVVMLLPVSGLVHNGPQITADRYSYLPCLGWALLAAGGLGAIWLYLRRTRSASATAAWILPSVLIVIAWLGVLTWRQTYVWHDTGTFWAQALAAAPSAMAHASVGTLLAEQGRAQEAISHYEEALRLNPKSGRIHISLGVELAKQGRLAEAISHDEEAVRLMPDAAVSYNNLGAALAAQGRTGEAIERYRQALRRLPTYAEAHNNLGRALSDTGQLGEATLHYREALRLRPDFAEVHDGLARALFKQGLVAEALGEFRETVRLRPADAVARYNLGNMLAGLGRPDEAATQFREALRLNPNLRQAQAALDAVLARSSRPSSQPR
jgi:tetratricopeptide (TPR) repeat protein